MQAPQAADPAYKKRQAQGLWNRYFLTNLDARLARPWTRLFVATGMTPNMVSLLSLAASTAGIVLVAFDPGPRNVVWLGGVLLLLGLVWDHSDGQVARLTGRGTLGGGLLDTIIDRWVETGWIIALGAGPFVGTPRELFVDWPRWVAIAAAAWAVHSSLYLHWANVQRNLYIIQKELRAARDQAIDPHAVVIDGSPLPLRPPEARTFYIPLAFNRDVTLWMLFVITLVPYWVIGLIVLAAIHTLVGLEKNWYTYKDLRRSGTTAVRSILDPDYHR